MSVIFGDEVAPQPPDLAAIGACLSQELALNLRGLKDDLAELKASLRSQVCHHRSVSRNGRLTEPAVPQFSTDCQQPQTCPPPPPALHYRATSLPRSAVSFAASPETSSHPFSPSAELGDARWPHGGVPAPALQRLLAPMLARAPARSAQVFGASPYSHRAPRAGSCYSALRRPSSSPSAAAAAASLVHPRCHSRDDASSSTVVVSPDMTPPASVAELDAAHAAVRWAGAVGRRRRASNSPSGDVALAAALQHRLQGLTSAADSDAARVAELQRRVAGLEQEVREGQRAAPAAGASEGNPTNKLRSRRLWFSAHRSR
ncbi:hypothetical protein HK405_012830 [Cladochytrium tenue]|nr:hypothetical protein HK405_012830 [Cladochytrium tenue]